MRYEPTLWKITVVKEVSKYKLKPVRLLGYVRCTPQYAQELSWKRDDILVRPVGGN